MADVVWLILDSLSHSLTPFAKDGPDTMPKFESIAREKGVVYTDAYVPGLFSAPSHGSFFTGYLPSETGMHREHPHFPGNHPTIAEGLSDTHESFIITDNPFVHNGLSDTFNNNHRIPVSNWELFDAEDTSINKFLQRSDREGPGKYVDFVLEGGKPVRSLVNGVSYKFQQKLADLGPGPSRASLGSWGEYTSKKVESYVRDSPHDVLAVANYMDPHPPFDPSDKALQQFLPDTPKSELPIHMTGRELQEYDIEKRLGLLKAATWDLDMHLGSLVERLVREGAFVAVTADHGHGFYRTRRFEAERIHVPLVIFAPDESARRIDHTCNIIELPTTTVEAVRGDSSLFPGESLLSLETDRISITESIRGTDQTTDGVEPAGNRGRDVVYELAGISNGSWVEYVEGEFTTRSDNGDRTAAIRARIEELLKKGVPDQSNDRPAYDSETMQRLKDFGYL